VGGRQGLPDEQTLRAVWGVKARRQAANADGAVVEIEKGIYSTAE